MKWTFEKLQKEALKYKTRMDFKKNCSGYQSALRNGVLDKICAHMEEIRHYWTNEELLEEALKYKSRSEFEFKSPKAYGVSLKRGLMDKICINMRSPITKPYTLKEILEEANKYTSRTDFAKNSGGAYNAAKKRNDFEEIVSHMNPSPNEPYTKEELQQEALKYNTRGEFYKMSKNFYQVAVKRSDYDQICSHMIEPYSSWNINKLKEEALKYKTRTEFQKKSKGAYLSAHRGNILDQICTHMENIYIPSSPETHLWDIIKSVYPKAQKFKELNIKISDRPYVNSFEIDIYIPELRKGIEFDGKYWHSEAGLKRSHPSWPEEGIREYHQIKDSYFLSKGIPILHIKEEDWNLDKEKCVQKCLDFLK